jgi:16S rRNA processing protein RimM
VGRVADAYGVRGWVKVEPYNDPQASVLRTSRRWWLATRGPLVIEGARVHGATIVAKAEGCDDRDAALALKGGEVCVRRADFPGSDEGEYYWVDLVGCRVSNPAGDDLGTVSSVEDYGAHPVLVTDDAAGVRRLIPFVAAHLVSVDPAARAIVADWAAED